MRTLDEFRHGLATETADLRVDLPVSLIRRRARRIRARRTALVAAALAVALAIPAGVLVAGLDRSTPEKGPAGPVCVTPGADGTVPWIGAPVEVASGAAFHDTDVHDVLVGVIYTVDQPVLTVLYHHKATGINEYGVVATLSRTPGGAFAGHTPDDDRELVVLRVNYGGVFTLDVGLYAGLADRVTITSDGATVEAKTVVNRAAGWTFFWSRQSPPSGQTPVTLTAYADDRVVASAPGEPGPGVWDVPTPDPGPPPTFLPTCS
jgi:hypothetical protein